MNAKKKNPFDIGLKYEIIKVHYFMTNDLNFITFY